LFERIGPVDNCIDGVFIAAARTDVPALVAEVRRLRELVLSSEWDAKVWLSLVDE
jgi:hypothetical protein